MRLPIKITILGPEPYDLDAAQVVRHLGRTQMFEGKAIVSRIEALPDSGPELLDEDLDEFISHLEPDRFHAIIVRGRIEDNYFVRILDYDYSLDAWKNAARRAVILISTHEMDWIAREHKINLSHLVSSIIWKFYIVYDFLKRGGKYFTLYASDKVEASIFNYCQNKEEIVDCYRAFRIGPRATFVLTNQYIPETQIAAWNKDINRLKFSRFERLMRWFEKNSVASGYVSGIITGIIVTLAFKMFE